MAHVPTAEAQSQGHQLSHLHEDHLSTNTVWAGTRIHRTLSSGRSSRRAQCSQQVNPGGIMTHPSCISSVPLPRLTSACWFPLAVWLAQ